MITKKHSKYSQLLDNSLAAALSAIEIYNKPDFKYRNEIFAILIINAWELLLKAKVLEDSNNDIEKLYIFNKKNGKPIKNRTGYFKTKELLNLANELNIDQTIKENITKFIEIRDMAIHFYNDKEINYIIYAISTAALKNYQKLINDWFERSLLEYNFYILPVGFDYNFHTLSTLDLSNKSDVVAQLLKTISEVKENVDESKGFYFTCEIHTQIVSAKKFNFKQDAQVVVGSEKKEAKVIFQKKILIDMYTKTYNQLFEGVKKILLKIKQPAFNRAINQIKGNEKYSE